MRSQTKKQCNCDENSAAVEGNSNFEVSQAGINDLENFEPKNKPITEENSPNPLAQSDLNEQLLDNFEKRISFEIDNQNTNFTTDSSSLTPEDLSSNEEISENSNTSTVDNQPLTEQIDRE